MNLQDQNRLDEFMNAAQAQNGEREIEILRGAVEEQGYNSELVHNLAIVISQLRRPYFNFLAYYLQQNPTIFHPCQVTLAAFYADTKKFDDATDEARNYLGRFFRSGLVNGLPSNQDLGHLIGRAFLIMTAVYTELGARNYSRRVLQRGLQFAISAVMRGHIENEIKNLERELTEPEIAKKDSAWEAFFTSGQNFSALFDECMARDFTFLARRLDLLEGGFRFDRSFRVDEDEILREVATLGENRYILMPSPKIPAL